MELLRMMYSKSTSPFIPNLLLTIIFCATIMAPHLQTAIAGPKKVVRITDLIPTHNPVQPPKVLNVHCKSKDDDLGLWTMTENQSREFHFQVNYWWTTLFWCRFDWGTKFANFVVFDANSRDGYDCRRERYCNWRVKTDGFYFAKGEFPKDSDFVRKGYWMDK